MGQGRFSPVIESDDDFLIVSASGSQPLIVYPKLPADQVALLESAKQSTRTTTLKSQKTGLTHKNSERSSLKNTKVPQQLHNVQIYHSPTFLLAAVLPAIVLLSSAIIIMTMGVPFGKKGTFPRIENRTFQLLSGYSPVQLRNVSLVHLVFGLPSVVVKSNNNKDKGEMVTERSKALPEERPQSSGEGLKGMKSSKWDRLALITFCRASNSLPQSNEGSSQSTTPKTSNTSKCDLGGDHRQRTLCIEVCHCSEASLCKAG